MRKPKILHFETEHCLASEQVAEDRFLEINYGSWFGKSAIYDIRLWNANHSDCEKGLKLSVSELQVLQKLLAGIQV